MNSLHLLCFRIFIIATFLEFLEITQLQSIRNIRLTSCNINFHINKMYFSYNLQWFSYIFHIRAQELFPEKLQCYFLLQKFTISYIFYQKHQYLIVNLFFVIKERLLKVALFLFVIELSFPNT